MVGDHRGKLKKRGRWVLDCRNGHKEDPHDFLFLMVNLHSGQKKEMNILR